MEKKIRFFFLLGMFMLTAFSWPLFSNNGDVSGDSPGQTPEPVPEALLRPMRGEAPRYPVDLLIGELGPGEADADVYYYARDALGALMAGDRQSVFLSSLAESEREEAFLTVREVKPRQYRLGGGRKEADGSISFLFRFMGEEKDAAGELYFFPADQDWFLEYLVIEQTDKPSGNSREGEYLPYERFF